MTTDSILHHYFNTNFQMPRAVLHAYQPQADPYFIDQRGSRRFHQPLADFDQLPILHDLHSLNNRISNTMQFFQDRLPLWAIGPETERDEAHDNVRIPDFVVFKYDSDIAGSFEIDNFQNYGYFEHTVVECKRGENSGYTMPRIVQQMHGQCIRLENHTKSCFAIAMKGFRVWFFEYFGEQNRLGIPLAGSFLELGFHFLRPHPSVLFWHQSLRNSMYWRMREESGTGDPLSGWDIRVDSMIIHHLFRYISSYNHPLGYGLVNLGPSSFVEVPFVF